MAIVEFIYSWYNPRNPKCRNCASWNPEEGHLSATCSNKDTKVHSKHRQHNDKACVCFDLKKDEPA